MLQPGRQTLLRIAVIALYALAMLTVGSVRHEPALSAAVSSAAYALPGGDALVLCQHDAGDQGQPGNGAPVDHGCCDSCLLMHAPGLGGVELPAIAHPPVARLAYGAPIAPAQVAIWRDKPSARGPPAA